MNNDLPVAKPVKRHLRAEDLTSDKERFHPRGGRINGGHVRDLRKLIERGNPLDALLVWQSPDDKLVLVDGYHRLRAYREAGKGKKMPCLVHTCSEAEARLLPMRHNSKLFLPLTPSERTDYAWRLTLDTKHSKRTIAQRCGIGERSVARMRAVLKAWIETGGEAPRSWSKAQKVGGDEQPIWDDERRKEHQERVKEEVIARCGPALYKASLRSLEGAIEAVEQSLGTAVQKSATVAAG